MKRKSERQKQLKKLEQIIHTAVKERDKWICQKCGKKVEKQNAHASHVLSRKRYPNLRFDLMNIKCLCYSCHINWWHKEPTEAGDWFKRQFPERWAYLESKRNDLTKVDLTELLNNNGVE